MSGTRTRGRFAVLAGVAVGAACVAAVGVSRSVHVAARPSACTSSDLALTQTIGAGPVDTVSVVNNGPCAATGVSVSVTVGGGSLPALSSVSADPTKLKCSESATTLVCTLRKPLDVSASVTLSFPATVGVSYHAVTALTSPGASEPGGALGLNNNSSWVTPLDPTTGGTVNQGSAGDSQISSLDVPFVSGGQSPTASIQLATFSCPAQFSENCLGTPVHTTSPVTTPGNPTTTVLSYLASTVPAGRIPTLYWSDNPPSEPWSPVAACTGPGATPDPCVQSVGYVTIGGQSYLQYVVLSSFDNYWF